MSVEVSKALLTTITKLPRDKQRRAMKLLGQQEHARCAEDVLYWLDASRHGDIPYVYTLDSHPMNVCNICKDSATYHFNKRIDHLQIRHELEETPDSLVRASFTELPTTRPFTVKDYMIPVIEWWLKEPLVAVEKSRDMIATWLIVALYLWDSGFHSGRQNIFQSDDAQKTMELVKRANFIWRNQPKFLRLTKGLFGAGVSRSGVLSFPTLNSEILGFPQGPDQIRQYHPSGVFQDEAAYQALAEDAFAAVKPAIQNGGRFTMVSSANPGFFYQICRDQTHV